MGAGTAKFKSLTALGEGHVAMLLDRGSIPLASTIQIHPFLQESPRSYWKARAFLFVFLHLPPSDNSFFLRSLGTERQTPKTHTQRHFFAGFRAQEGN